MGRRGELTGSADTLSRLFNPKLDPEAYNYVATKSALISIQLVSSHFEVNPDFFKKNDKIKIELHHGISDINFYGKTEMVAGFFRYEVVAKVARKHVLTARADFLAIYDVPPGSAENEAKAFCARVGLFAAYPYFRALFAHLIAAGNVELPILPVLSADPLRRPKGKQSTVKTREKGN